MSFDSSELFRGYSHDYCLRSKNLSQVTFSCKMENMGISPPYVFLKAMITPYFFPPHILLFLFFLYLCRIVRAHLTQVKGEYIQREKRPPTHPRIHMPLLLHLVTIRPSVLLLDIWKCGTFGSHQTEEISLHKSQASPFI